MTGSFYFIVKERLFYCQSWRKLSHARGATVGIALLFAIYFANGISRAGSEPTSTPVTEVPYFALIALINSLAMTPAPRLDG